MKKTMPVSLAVCLLLFACITFSCSRKEPDPPKPPQVKVELPPPKPPEPPKLEKTEEPVPEKQVIKISPKKTHTQKPKTPVIPPALPSKNPAPSKTVNLDGLNRELKTHHLNVWVSEWSSEGIILNGYVKSEREREDALSIARRYSPNITDMINTVTVYDTGASATGRRHQPYPYSK